jgi:hypothetical protein
MPPVPDWRSAAAYAYLNDLTPAEYAWEFLRRNPNYRSDYRTAAETTVKADPLEPWVVHWGLRFPDRSGSECG